jgi:16S rRNA (cytidine1402-2'-O)-methyltransferase
VEQSGRLYLVATPIGNLEDITARALRVLRESAWIACEDTRVTRKLLDHYDIATETVSFHAHSSERDLERILNKLEEGGDVALVSDAGTPLVSDPGHELVNAALARGIEVVPIPGPSAALAALTGSGLPTAKVLFLGFLPRDDAPRREILGPLRSAPYTLVVYEAPSRVPATLEALNRSLGDRDACLARELTKKFESFDRRSLATLAQEKEPPRGEVVLVIGPPKEAAQEASEELLRVEASRLLESGMKPSEAAKTIAGAFGLSKSAAYQLVLEVARDHGR